MHFYYTLWSMESQIARRAFYLPGCIRNGFGFEKDFYGKGFRPLYSLYLITVLSSIGSVEFVISSVSLSMTPSSMAA